MGYQMATTLVFGILAFFFGRFIGVQVRIGMSLLGVDMWPSDRLRLSFEDASWMSAGTGMVLPDGHGQRDFHEEYRKFQDYRRETQLLFGVPDPTVVPRVQLNGDGLYAVPEGEAPLNAEDIAIGSHESCFLEGKCAIRYSCIKMQKAPAGGQPVCLDFIRDDNMPDLSERDPCVAYSFMTGTKIDWEVRLLRQSACEVFVMNPMMSPDEFRNIVKDAKLSSAEAKRITLLQAGLPGMVPDSVPKETREKREATFGQIKKELNHARRILQIIRIDCGGCEFKLLKENAMNKPFRMVRQLILRLHKSQMTNPETAGTVDDAFNMLRNLVDRQSMELVHHEYTSDGEQNSSPENQNVDIAFIMPRW